MKFKNKNGILQIIISYFILWFPVIIIKITKTLNKDLFFICIILAVIVMVDGKMKYKNIFVKLNFWAMIFLLLIMLIAHIL